MPCQSLSLTSAPYSRAQQHKTGRRIRRGPPLAIIVNMTVLALVSNWWSASLYVILSLWQPLSVEHGVSFAFQWLNIASSPSDQGRYLPLLVVWWSAQQGLGCIFVWRITAIVSFGWWWSIVAKCFKVFSFFTSVSIPSPKFQCHLRPPSMITCPLCMPTPRHPPLLQYHNPRNAYYLSCGRDLWLHSCQWYRDCKIGFGVMWHFFVVFVVADVYFK